MVIDGNNRLHQAAKVMQAKRKKNNYKKKILFTSAVDLHTKNGEGTKI